MKKLKNFDKNYLFIALFCALLIYIVIPDNAIFGSNTDWISQHAVFPNYFRDLFYQTKNLFPSFAMQIGGGQNIYNFSYYGLLNPLLMISYLLPMISIKNFIIVENIILYIIFGLITYYFFKRKTTNKVALITTLILVMAAPVVFHFHRHFMFVSYLPFLMLALIGVDKFFETNNKSLVAFSTFMIIMISYYYAIPSIIAICLYAVYKYLEENREIRLKPLIQKGLTFCIPIVIAIISSAILLLPTYSVLKTGRPASPEIISMVNRFLPTFNVSAILYDRYSMGLTAISLIAMLYCLTSKEKENKFLSWFFLIFLCIPIFIFTLNGGLYFRNKVLIPFIPLFGLFLVNFIEQIITKKIDIFKLIVIIILLLGSSLLLRCTYYSIYADVLILLGIVIGYKKDLTNEFLLVAVILFVPMLNVFIANTPKSYMNEKENEKIDNIEITKAINKTLDKEEDIVRFNNLNNKLESINQVYDFKYNQNSVYSSVSNQLYKTFYEKVFNNALSYRNNLVLSQNNDILFQTFMGVKYIYSSNSVPVGYTKIRKNIYMNDNVLPMYYGTSKITNEAEFDKLPYPENITKLLSSVVVRNENTTNTKVTAIKKVNLEYDVIDYKNIEVEQKDNYLKVKSKKNGGTINLQLKEPLDKDILIMNITLLKRQSCEKGDLRITINDVSNILTCKEWMYRNDNKTFHYVLSKGKGITNLKIKLNPGTYKISSIDTYKLNYNDLSNIKEHLSKFNIDKETQNGDKVTGTINMSNNGYFVTSIPYDKGFNVLVDNNKVKTEIINKAFLGFKLEKGEHNIVIDYKAPLRREGIILSIIGFISFIILLICDIKNRKGSKWKKYKSSMKKLKI